MVKSPWGQMTIRIYQIQNTPEIILLLKNMNERLLLTLFNLFNIVLPPFWNDGHLLFFPTNAITGCFIKHTLILNKCQPIFIQNIKRWLLLQICWRREVCCCACLQKSVYFIWVSKCITSNTIIIFYIIW